VVIGLPNVTTAGDLQGSGQGLVERWAIDEAAGGARLRLDLKANAEVRRRFLLPPGDGASAYRYVIDLKSTDAPGAVQTPALKPTLVSAPVKASALRLKKVIVIDAGHGGKDPGSSGANTAEKDVTLAAAKALKTKLEKSGRYTVVMTRQSDTFVPLESACRSPAGPTPTCSSRCTPIRDPTPRPAAPASTPCRKRAPSAWRGCSKRTIG
jgi:N-acetylmuramoyl-L-alanine amidase